MFFVLTTGRSGSTSIAKYLSTFSDIVCLHEPKPSLIEEATQYIHKCYPHDKMVNLLRSTRPLQFEGKEYGECSQKLSFVIPAILDAFPDSKFIWLVRDGRSVVNSIFGLGWYDPDFPNECNWRSNLPQAHLVGDLTQERWQAFSPFEKCCWYWQYTNHLISSELNSVEKNNWVLIRLEIVEFEKINKLLNINITKNSIPWVNKKRKIKKNEGWPAWDNFQKESFREICGTQMNELYPGWVNNKGEWVDVIQIPFLLRMQHFIQDKMVNVEGKNSLIYKMVSIPVHFIFRSHAQKILSKLDFIYKKLSGEY